MIRPQVEARYSKHPIRAPAAVRAALRGLLFDPLAGGYQGQALGIIELQVESRRRSQPQVRIPPAPLPDVQYVVAHIGNHISLVFKTQAVFFSHRMRGRQNHLQPALARRARPAIPHSRAGIGRQAFPLFVEGLGEREQAGEIKRQHPVRAGKGFQQNLGLPFHAVVRLEVSLNVVGQRFHGARRALGEARRGGGARENAPLVGEKPVAVSPRRHHAHRLWQSFVIVYIEPLQGGAFQVRVKEGQAGVAQQIFPKTG